MKVYGTILDSSVWGEPLAVRVVWIAMLAMADKNGVVAASSDGIARRANVPLKATEKALAVLESPDPRSKSPDYDGRRIERIDGGWKILNYERYRDKRSDKQVKDANRQKRHRDGNVTERDVTPSHTTSQRVAAEAEADTEVETTTTPPLPRVASFLETLLAKVPHRPTWEAEIQAMLDGMLGHHRATREQIETAARDMLANGVTTHPNLRQFRRYVEGAKPEANNGQRKPRQSVAEQGYASAKAALQHIPDND